MRWGEGKENGRGWRGMTTTTMMTTMYVAYNNGGNDDATKALSDRGIQGGGDFWTQSTIKLELGVERGGAHVQMTMTTTMRPGEKNTQQPTTSSGRAIEGERDGGVGSWQ